MSLTDTPAFEAISAKAYEHPADRAATSALRTIPLLDKVVKRLADLSHERRLRQILVGDSVRIDDHQVPGPVVAVRGVRPHPRPRPRPRRCM